MCVCAGVLHNFRAIRKEAPTAIFWDPLLCYNHHCSSTVLIIITILLSTVESPLLTPFEWSHEKKAKSVRKFLERKEKSPGIKDVPVKVLS